MDRGRDEGPADDANERVGDANGRVGDSRPDRLESRPPQELIRFRLLGEVSKSQVLALLSELGGLPRDAGPRMGEDVLEDMREVVVSQSSSMMRPTFTIVSGWY